MVGRGETSTADAVTVGGETSTADAVTVGGDT